VLAIGHVEGGKIIIDLVIKQAGEAHPFNPWHAVKRFVPVLQAYGLSSVMGDSYAGNTFKSAFEELGITYNKCPKDKSDLYEAFEPALNGGEVELPDLPKLQEQFITLVVKGAKIDHETGGHDDYANAVAGVVWRIKRATMRRQPNFVAGPDLTKSGGAAYDYAGSQVPKGYQSNRANEPWRQFVRSDGSIMANPGGGLFGGFSEIGGLTPQINDWSNRNT
jgi:hypothetical protein